MARPSSITPENMRLFLAHSSERNSRQWSEVLGVTQRRVRMLADEKGVEIKDRRIGRPPKYRITSRLRIAAYR